MNISPTENMHMAMSAVWAHRFRSLLTILGIVIGITTVVTVASLLTGLRQGVVTFFQELGPDNIFLFRTSGDPSQNNQIPKEAKRKPLKAEYADDIKRWCMSVQDVGLQILIPPVVDGNPITVRVPGFESETINVAGKSANMADIAPRDFDAGRFFTPEEEQRTAHVVMLGSSVAEALFPNGNPVGRTLMMDGAEYTVIGVYAKAKGGFFGENGMDNAVDMPLKTAQSRYPQVDRYMITAQAKPGHRQEAFEEVDGVMRRLRRLPTGTADDFSISTPDQIIQQFDRITGLIGLVAIAISALGLLVGGIGVMNIMLVSVTERTREIGVRKALGATRGTILWQFLVEAATLTMIGAVTGLVIGGALTYVIRSNTSIKASIPPLAIVVALLAAAFTGILFGLFPAYRAAKLDPVEALRYE